MLILLAVIIVIVLVRQYYRRKQRDDLELPAATNNTKAIAAAAKANILYDNDAYTNPSDFTSPAHQHSETADKNFYDVPRQTDGKN